HNTLTHTHKLITHSHTCTHNTNVHTCALAEILILKALVIQLSSISTPNSAIYKLQSLLQCLIILFFSFIIQSCFLPFVHPFNGCCFDFFPFSLLYPYSLYRGG